MDDATFRGLEAALAATPDNHPLRAVLVRACLERGDATAGLALLEGIDAAALPPDGRMAAATLCLGADQAPRALELLGDLAAPEARITAARALLVLGRRAEGLAAYHEAVAGNATLENPELEAALRPESPPPSHGGDGRLRIVSGPPTTDETLDRLLAPPAERIGFDDVGGLEDVKKAIRRRIITPFDKPTLFQRFRRKVGGGVLLFGPPGCGKTMIARATAGEVNATFINVAISDVLDMYIGESERKLHALFERARDSAPAVLFFDELEALAGNRKYARESSVGKLVSLFLSEMDGFAENNHGVLLVGATNVPWSIDPAFQRPGRFDRVIFVPPPDAAARHAILSRLLASRPTEGDLRVELLVRRTKGFSGADLTHLVETAVDEAIDESLAKEDTVSLSWRHLEAALPEVRATTAEWLTTARNYARYANDGGRYDDVLAFLERHGKG
ncbi:MAG: AAA family ATPase [Myxococcales bacterium]|nr:AAA family ATPase [Myxococcales bacterium]